MDDPIFKDFPIQQSRTHIRLGEVLKTYQFISSACVLVSVEPSGYSFMMVGEKNK